MLPSWMKVAMGEIGVKEIPGQKHSPRVVEYHSATGLGAKDDETPWCASFTAWVFRQAGIKYEDVRVRAAAARTWLGWGRELKEPIPGALMVLSRGSSSTSGHTTFFVEKIDEHHFRGLGGNQSNAVNISTYRFSDVLSGGVRWPSEIPLPAANQPLKDSGVVRWSMAGIAGFITLLYENGQYIVTQLLDADRVFKGGTALSAVAGTVIILALVGILYSRVKGKKDESKISGEK